MGKLDDEKVAHVAAQCCKNMGAALEKLGKEDDARAFYERALELDPDLGPSN